ncbi:hypothetical protein SAMN05216565_103178 [Litchfieldia salsa]|uniref:Uncharacterized protein n=1 Tax=Litchfieldia salsa TaxID=930152 RepID=A0A1H0SXK7_9BACI|nr:hypothetical protein SAMN05216565_103178 [Litchfieldia salsa]
MRRKMSIEVSNSNGEFKRETDINTISGNFQLER